MNTRRKSAERSTNPVVGDESAVEGRDIEMRAQDTSRHTLDGAESAFVATDPRASAPRSASIHLLNSSTRAGQHRGAVRSARVPPTLRNEMAELLVDGDGLPVL